MINQSWQLQAPLDAIIFDCDGTLSAIEGIDELALIHQVGDIVQRLTAEAMGKTGMTLDIYRERLQIVRPTLAQTLAIGERYIQQQVPDAQDLITILQRLNKPIYIVSAGLQPAVTVFGEFLKVPVQHIFAVDVQYDQQGNYVDFDHASPMTRKNGKREIVDHIKKMRPRTAYIGDGLSDYEVYDLVTRFIGFGGAYYRQQIEARCDFYLKCLSMAALVPLLLTEEEQAKLNSIEKQLLQRGLNSIQQKEVSIRAR